MANFKTHLMAGAFLSCFLSTTAFHTHLITADQILPLVAAGTMGGILPDIDLQNSSPSKLLFSVLGMILAFAALLKTAGRYSLLEMWLLWAGVFLSVRYAIWKVFHEYTSHRGIFHSILAASFFFFVGTSLYYNFFISNAAYAWLIGSFIFIGYILHLLLDEAYAVDFEGTRLKRSFGTALKLCSYKNPKTTGIFLVATLLAWFVTPSSESFQQMINDNLSSQQLFSNLFPKGRWFQ